MRCLPSPRRVKRAHPYTVKELARLLDRTAATIRAWITDGLRPADRGRPILIMGSEVHRYLNEKRGAARKKCGPGEMFCVACRDVRRPAYDDADYIPITAMSGNLRGLCPACGNLMHRRVQLARIGAVRGPVKVQFQQGQPSLNGMTTPSHNPDSRQES